MTSLPLPRGFGTEVDVFTGETRRQIAPGQFEESPFLRVSERYAGRRFAGKLLGGFRSEKNGSVFPTYRVCRCGLFLKDAESGVSVLRSTFTESRVKAHFGGLVQCGSVWHCPVCSSKIAARRQAELQIALLRQIERGGVVGMATATVPHLANQDCSLVLERVQTLYSRLTAGRRSSVWRDSFSVVGTVRALEFTFGIHGWHPHMHTLIFCKFPVAWQSLEESLFSIWSSSARQEFGWNLPRLALRVHGGDFAASYVSKWGLAQEMTAGNASKKGDQDRESCSPFQLLWQAGHGDKRAAVKWIEFATTVSKRGENRVQSVRQLVWSRGLKKHFEIGDFSDEELAEQELEPSVLLGVLSFEDWQKVLAQPFDARVVLLQIASSGTFDDIVNFVSSLPETQTF